MVTPAADIFAWGCLVAYAGNGRHPFGRGDVITLATRVLHAPPDLGTLPPPLDELVRRATAMSPADRPSAQDLLLALVGGSAPSTAGNTLTAVNSPTLVTDELLSDWEPPQNVIDEPDLTTNFAGTPPRLRYCRKYREKSRPPTQLQRHKVPPSSHPHSRRARHQSPAYRPRHDRGAAPPLGTRWLIAAAAAILAMALTAGILIYQGSQTTTPPAQAPAAQAANRTTDVGRRYPLGKEFDGPQLVIPNAPECGLTDYQGAQPSKGRFCLIRWTLINPGGDLTLLGNPVVTLVDDRNARLDPLPSSTPLPAALPPGGRVDGVLVFDLAPARTPARLSATMFDGGKQIEVTL